MPLLPRANDLSTEVRLLTCVGAVLFGAANEASAQFTEVPSTVPIGTWQVEADVAAVSWDSRTLESGVAHRHWTFGSTLLTTGVGQKADVQIGYVTFVDDVYSSALERTRYRGRGDIYIRSKWNFWGTEAETSALAVLPYIKIPTNTGGVGNDRVEGGLVVPFGMPLGTDTSLNAMVSADYLDDGNGGTDVLWSASWVVTRSVSTRWATYAEAGATVDLSNSGDWAGTVGVGLTFAATEKFSLDLAGYAGITRSAPDWSGAFRIVWVW
jgi:Putative MetA-pathway of phenol degradation